MNVYMTEAEQVEQLKALWARYGNSFLSLLLVLVLAFTAWQWWQRRVEKINTQASIVYEQLLSQVMREKTDKITVLAERLKKDYTKTPYATLAAFHLARLAVNEKQLSRAKAQLQFALGQSQVPAFRQVARLRLARILMAETQFQAALDLLKTVDDKSYQGSIAQLQGDIYVALDQPTKAHQAYASALKTLPPHALVHGWIQMKQDNVMLSEKHVAQRGHPVAA